MAMPLLMMPQLIQ